MKPLDKENRACKYPPWRILKESLNDRACRFSRWEWFSVTNSDKQKDCLCFKGQKKDVPCKNLSHQTDKHYFKVMVAATLTLHEVMVLLFINKKALKIITESYYKHLHLLE